MSCQLETLTKNPSQRHLWAANSTIAAFIIFKDKYPKLNERIDPLGRGFSQVWKTAQPSIALVRESRWLFLSLFFLLFPPFQPKHRLQRQSALLPLSGADFLSVAFRPGLFVPGQKSPFQLISLPLHLIFLKAQGLSGRFPRPEHLIQRKSTGRVNGNRLFSAQGSRSVGQTRVRWTRTISSKTPPLLDSVKAIRMSLYNIFGFVNSSWTARKKNTKNQKNQKKIQGFKIITLYLGVNNPLISVFKSFFCVLKSSYTKKNPKNRKNLKNLKNPKKYKNPKNPKNSRKSEKF